MLYSNKQSVYLAALYVGPHLFLLNYLKRYLLPFLVLAVGLGNISAAHAQANLIRMGINSAILAKRLSKGNAASPTDGVATTPTTVASTSGSYEGKTFPMVRTPTDQLPKKGAEQVAAMETELERCHTALLASPTGTICTPEQRTALQAAIMNVARSQATRNLTAYQQEATFYLAEDARRQPAAVPTTSAK
jgi:hypothetical protein